MHCSKCVSFWGTSYSRPPIDPYLTSPHYYKILAAPLDATVFCLFVIVIVITCTCSGDQLSRCRPIPSGKASFTFHYITLVCNYCFLLWLIKYLSTYVTVMWLRLRKRCNCATTLRRPCSVLWLRPWCHCDKTCQSPSDVIILLYFYLLTSISYVIQVP